MSALVLLHAARLYDAKLSFYDLIYALFKGLYIEFVIVKKVPLRFQCKLYTIALWNMVLYLDCWVD